MMRNIRLALLSDLHYAAMPNAACPRRRGEYIPALLAAAVRKLNRELKPDLVLCGGDLINFPAAEDALTLTRNLAGILGLLDMPCVTIRGNHDVPAAEFTGIFPFRSMVDIGPVRIVSFSDPELPGFHAYRTEEDLKRMKEAATGWDGPLFSFQHVPLLPRGRCIYEYRNAEEILQLMSDCGYLGSISGHYHNGIPLFEENGLQYFVQSAMCESPFAVSLVDIGGNGIAGVETVRIDSELIIKI